ncbi:protoporphyrinogen oxidase [Alteribacillus sp. HJP-4]|uniref:protoporphyrinogen oxidase n=1 Tax=Alteribacillus sp. HJP-4 TaxID=2775394 RepID=UPI0035CD3302
MKVAIIGGGITGLAAAHFLEKIKKTSQYTISYDLFESSAKLGGKISTDYTDGFVIERGPDSFLARKESAARLAKEVGLEDQLLSNSAGQAYVLKGKKLYPIPSGAIMGIPTEWTPFLKTGLFSSAGKLRAAADLVLPKNKIDGDQSLGKFFRRRLGNEVVDNLIEPLLSGIYAGDINNLSLQSTFPQFKEVEQRHRSLIVGMKAGREPQKKTNKKPSMFLSLKGGLQTFVNALEQNLDSNSVHKNTTVKRIERIDNRYAVTFYNGNEELYDKVISSVPPNIAGGMLENKEVQRKLQTFSATTVATAALAFEKDQVKNKKHGTGFVVSKKSGFTITACTFTHLKWKHTAPADKALLRCYVGKPDGEDIVYKSDEEISRTVMKDLSNVIEIKGDPLFSRITRWEQSMPQYEVGHKEKIADIRACIERIYPGLILTGAAFHGVGLPDCIDQGEAAAHQALDLEE